MCTPYKIEAFADNSRSGEEAGTHAGRRLINPDFTGFLRKYLDIRMK